MIGPLRGGAGAPRGSARVVHSPFVTGVAPYAPTGGFALALIGHICACMGVVASPVGSLRIVVIDDDADLRETLVEALRERGHAVIGLPAQAGVFSLSDSPPADAWVVDHRLPGRLGGDVVRALRQMGGERRPVLVGVSGDEGAEREFAAAGADLFLLKPFSPSDLVDAIVRAVERERAGRDHQ